MLGARHMRCYTSTVVVVVAVVVKSSSRSSSSSDRGGGGRHRSSGCRGRGEERVVTKAKIGRGSHHLKRRIEGGGC